MYDVRTLLTAGGLMFWASAPAWSQATGAAGTAGAAAQAGGSPSPAASATQAGGPGQAATATQGTGRGNAGMGAQVFNPFSGSNQTPFFANPAVRQELQLNNQQFNRLNQNFLQNRQAFNARLDALQAQGNLTPAQRLQLAQQFNRQFSTGLNGVFTNQQNLNRFNQLTLQSQGFNAFLNPAIHQQLNLTADQQARLSVMASQWNSTLQHLTPEFRSNPGAVQPQLDRLQREQAQQLQLILNPQQLQTWRQLIGEPFSFPASTFFPAQGTTGQR